MANRPSKLMSSAATHPGQLVVEYLEFFNLSQSDLARRTDLPSDEIANICGGTAPISPRAALAFQEVLERPAHLWSNLQMQFDDAVASRESARLPIAPSEWPRRFPVEEH